MANLNDLIQLAEADGGKFFVMDEKGEARLVIMKVEDYECLLLGKLQKKMEQQAEDVEKINKEILRAQLQEPEILTPVPEVPKAQVAAPQVIYSQTAQIPSALNKTPRVDLREEVIDPSFDFEGPKADLEDF